MTSYTLSISPTSDPFPFAALATASYIKDSVNVSFNFEHGENGLVLTRTEDGTQITNAEEVVRTLAKAAGIQSNSTQVSPRHFGRSGRRVLTD
jgi:glutamyl-tRNA synthetase